MKAQTHLRFRNYDHLANGVHGMAFDLYVFDLGLRAVVIKAMSILETELQLHLGFVQTDKRFLTFGALRKRIFNKPIEARQHIAEAFGLRNPKELAAVLLQMNEARNFAAHHARLWNRRFHFSIPMRLAVENKLNCGIPVNNNSTAACFSALKTLLASCPKFIDLDSEIDLLLHNAATDRAFLLQKMGFEVP